MTVAEVAALIGGTVVGDQSVAVGGLSNPQQAGPSDLVVAFNDAAVAAAQQSQAVALVVPESAELEDDRPLVRVPQPQVAFIKLLHAFAPPPPQSTAVDPRAVVHATARLGADVSVAPGAVVGAEVVLGDRCRVGANTVVGDGCRLGDDVVLHANVTLYERIEVGHRVIIHSGAVIGADGYGFYKQQGVPQRIPQIGTVILEDDVEVGACTTIDRATVGATRIGAATKLDNLVHIAHNCVIGRNGLIAGQVGFAGSCTVGDGVTMGGQVGLADHLTVGDNVTLGARSGVMHNVPEDAQWLGAPAMDRGQALRIMSAMRHLPDLLRRLRALDRRLEGSEPGAE